MLARGLLPGLLALGVGLAAPTAGAQQPSDYRFQAADGTRMVWKRVAPGYGAWTLDQRVPSGTIVFAGVPDTLDGNFETQDCQSVGCHVYRVDPGGRVERLFSQGGGYGIMKVGLSAEGDVGAVSIDTDPGVAYQGRLLSWRAGTLRTNAVAEQAFSLDYDEGGFTAVTAKRVASGGFGGWRSATTDGCALFDVNTSGPVALFAGFGGTYRASAALAAKSTRHVRKRRHRQRRRHVRKRPRKHKRARHSNPGGAQPAPAPLQRFGPPSDAVWSSPDGRTIAISEALSSNNDRLLLSVDGGRGWRSQTLVDNVGAGACQNKASNDSSDCNDLVSGARLMFTAFAGADTGDLWAVGGRRDIPGGRVYRYAGSDRWERVPFPADIWFASDIVDVQRGAPLVASIDGIYQATPAP